MRRLFRLRCTGLGGLATAFLIALVVSASGAYAADSSQAERQKMIQSILEKNKGDAAGLEASIQKVFGQVQGSEAVARAQQILDALPSEISDADWQAIKAALEAKASGLALPAASASIARKIAAKEAALSKTRQLARAAEDDSVPAAKRAAPSPPPQQEVDCSSGC